MLDWPIIGVLVALVSAWSGIFLFAIKWLLDRNRDYLEQRFQALEQCQRRAEEIQRQADSRLQSLKIEITANYTHREDFIRAMATQDAKADALYAAIEQVKERLHDYRFAQSND